MNHKALKNDFNVSYRTKSAPSGTDKAFGKSPAARPISNRNPICSAQKSLEPTARISMILFLTKVATELNTPTAEELGTHSALHWL